ncbi:ABC transporter permease [Puniceicoccaceae bacterium K14]|nr:ABC transporter permease [Puniceicoccaceae bacterium K14]
MPTIKYDSTPALRHPLRLLYSMWTDLLASRDLAWRLFIRDLKARHRASILGYLWILLPPLAITGTFLLLQKAKVMNVGELPVPYPLYVITGTTFWQLFADAVQSPLKIVNQSKSMLVKINFPREALILTAAMETLFTFAVRISILAICLLLFHTHPSTLNSNLILLPIAITGILIVGLSIGVLLTPFGVLFQDFSQGIPLALSAWLIATPIAYPASQASGLLSQINQYNPLSSLIDWPRSLILSIDSSSQFFCITITAISIALATIAWGLFRIALPHVISRIGS